jgi:hypothetical protein
MTTTTRTANVGQRPSSSPMPAARRDGAAAGQTPEFPMTTTPRRGAVSAGHPPANPRTASPTREYQSGSGPTHHDPARRPHYPRPPPPHSLRAANPAASRPFVLGYAGRSVLTHRDAALYPKAGEAARKKDEERTRKPGQTTNSRPRNLTEPFHIRKPMLCPLSYEGDGHWGTCQPIPTSDRASQPVPTRPGLRLRRLADHTTSTPRGPTGPRVNPYQPVPASPDECQRLTEQPPITQRSTWVDYAA